jgi:hypothetical protein
MPVFIGAALILRRGRESAPEAVLADIQVGWADPVGKT